MSFALHEAMRIGALCLSVPAFSVPSKGEKRKGMDGWEEGRERKKRFTVRVFLGPGWNTGGAGE